MEIPQRVQGYQRGGRVAHEDRLQAHLVQRLGNRAFEVGCAVPVEQAQQAAGHAAQVAAALGNFLKQLLGAGGGVVQAIHAAMLAGLPPIVGLYASTIPLFLYAIFGTSRQLAVGPVAMKPTGVSGGDTSGSGN